MERLPRAVDDLVVDEPPGLFVYRARDPELDLETMTVQARTLVPFGNLRKPVSGFETKLFDQSDAHDEKPSSFGQPGTMSAGNSRCASFSARARVALPRCERRFFSSADSSALVHRA